MKKICSSCNYTIIEYKKKYCDKCSSKMQLNKKDNARLYNQEVRYKRDLKFTKFYASKPWKTTADIVRNKYKGLCLMCLLLDDEINVSDVVHHIIELRAGELGWEHRLDLNNLVPLCHQHHNSFIGAYTKVEQDMLRELIKEYEKIYVSED